MLDRLRRIFMDIGTILQAQRSVHMFRLITSTEEHSMPLFATRHCSSTRMSLALLPGDKVESLAWTVQPKQEPYCALRRVISSAGRVLP